MHSDATMCEKRKSTWIVTWLICLILIGPGMTMAKTDYINRDDLFSIFFVNDVLGWSWGFIPSMGAVHFFQFNNEDMIDTHSTFSFSIAYPNPYLERNDAGFKSLMKAK